MSQISNLQFSPWCIIKGLNRCLVGFDILSSFFSKGSILKSVSEFINSDTVCGLKTLENWVILDCLKLTVLSVFFESASFLGIAIDFFSC
jgi:hypothetical protein